MKSFEENFSDEQRKSLLRFVTNLDSNIFALKNLPEVVKGALFSKYSRSILGLRSLLIKEFLEDETNTYILELDRGNSLEDGIKKASNFYERVLDGYGDDSIGELGGAHLAIEQVSMLAAKVLEDSRIGGSPLEKSTRYVYFDQKIKGEFLYYRDPILMTSAFKTLFLSTCDHLFQVYSDLIPEVTSYFEKIYPKKNNVSLSAYTVSLRAKVLDVLRGLLPTATLTNMGMYGNGRFWQNLFHRLQSHNLSEIKEIGENSLNELRKVIPSFLTRAESHHRHNESMIQYRQSIQDQLSNLADRYCFDGYRNEIITKPQVNLVHEDMDGIYKICAGFLYPYSNLSLEEIVDICKKLSEDEIMRVLEAGTLERGNRRHKSPRGLECATFGFDIVADFGAYRDLQRHRILTQERQLLTTHLGYQFPIELIDTPMEKKYMDAMDVAREAYEEISEEFREEAQYVVPMGYNIRWFFNINARALQWLCELRSQPQGHANYRYIAIEMVRAVIAKNPMYKMFFKFVNYENLELGRLDQEKRKESKVI